MIREFSANDLFLILEGLKWTVLLSIIAISLSVVIGLGIGASRTMRNRVFNILSSQYILFFLNTPLLLQLFIVYFGIALLGINTSAWASAIVALCLHGSAYYAEIWRGAIGAVSKGQQEAAKALGISRPVTFALITLPQAVRVCLPALVGFSVQLIKGTSLTSIIGFVELTRSAQIVNGSVYKPMLIFGLIGMLYFALCYPVSHIADKLERKMSIGKKGV